MTREELQKVLAEHKKWVNGEDGKRADLRHTDLSATDLSLAVLRHADMSGANLDYSCWPLCYGSLDAHIDTPHSRAAAIPPDAPMSCVGWGGRCV